jgi:hypothetical protein
VHSETQTQEIGMSWKDEYRRKAKEQTADAEELESGRWRWGNVGGVDESESLAKRKRGLAAKLFGLAGDDD